MLERRMSKQEEVDLIKELENKAKLIENFLKKHNLQDGTPLTQKDYESLAKISFSLGADTLPVTRLLDQGIQDLEECGMKELEVKGVSVRENVFFQYAERDDDGNIVPAVDETVLQADEHFGEVIKKGRYLQINIGGDNTMRGKRDQARDEAMDKYLRAMKSKPDLDHKAEFLHGVIDLASGHSTVLFGAKKSLHALGSGEIAEEERKMWIKPVLDTLIDSLKKTADAVRRISNYSHLMSAKEFQLQTNVLYQRRPDIMKEIDSILKSLEEPVSDNNYKISFWKKPVAISTSLNPLERANKILELKEKLSEAIMAIDPSSSYANRKRKSGLEKLLRQVDYEIHRNNSVFYKKMNSWEVAPAKLAKP
ncbi:MAG: hypothetical protein K0R24_82 [Gammaproteobacteria bacterium]|jgi:hypothetical protein|nr:hypothetical protein [Gammaproteobacteria bacterium]